MFKIKYLRKLWMDFNSVKSSEIVIVRRCQLQKKMMQIQRRLSVHTDDNLFPQIGSKPISNILSSRFGPNRFVIDFILLACVHMTAKSTLIGFKSAHVNRVIKACGQISLLNSPFYIIFQYLNPKFTLFKHFKQGLILGVHHNPTGYLVDTLFGLEIILKIIYRPLLH